MKKTNKTFFVPTKSGVTWREIIYRGYKFEVSNEGVVKMDGKTLKQRETISGYMNVYPQKKGCTSVGVHRLVASAFIPNPDNLPQVNHLNHQKHDNRVENLEWISVEDNNAYSNTVTKRFQGEVYQFGTDGKLIRTYKDIKEASKVTGYNYDNLTKVIRMDNSRPYHGYIWKREKKI